MNPFHYFAYKFLSRQIIYIFSAKKSIYPKPNGFGNPPFGGSADPQSAAVVYAFGDPQIVLDSVFIEDFLHDQRVLFERHHEVIVAVHYVRFRIGGCDVVLNAHGISFRRGGEEGAEKIIVTDKL